MMMMGASSPMLSYDGVKASVAVPIAHQRERHQQSLPPAMAVHVGPQNDRPERTRDGRDGIGEKRVHQRDERAFGGKERFGDIGGEIGVDEEVVELEKIAGARPNDGLHLLFALFGRQHRVTPSPAGGRASPRDRRESSAPVRLIAAASETQSAGAARFPVSSISAVLMVGVKPPKIAVAVTKASANPVVRTFCGHDLGQKRDHRAVVEPEYHGEPQHDREQLAEARIGHEPAHRRIGRQQRDDRNDEELRPATDAIGKRTAEGKPDEVGEAGAERDDHGVDRLEPEGARPEGRGVHRDGVERGRREDRHHHADGDDLPIGAQDFENLARFRRRLGMEKGLGLRQRAAQPEDDRNDQTADDDGHAPTPRRHLVAREHRCEGDAEDGGEHDGDLLTARLPGGIEAAIAGGGDLREIDRAAADLDAGGEALDQTAHHDDDRSQDADRLIPRRKRDRGGADRHQRQREDQTRAAPHTVGIGAENHGPDRPYEEPRTVGEERGHQRDEFVVGGEEGPGDVGRVIAVDDEVVHLEEIAGGHADHGFDLLSAFRGRKHAGSSYELCFSNRQRHRRVLFPGTQTGRRAARERRSG